jgi:hypothetical protein
MQNIFELRYLDLHNCYRIIILTITKYGWTNLISLMRFLDQHYIRFLQVKINVLASFYTFFPQLQRWQW